MKPVGCDAEPMRTVDLPDAFCDEHQSCDDGATAALCTLIDAPHVPYLAAALSGIPIADIAWDFFNEKTLVPEPASTWLQLAALATLAAFRARRRRS